MVVAWRGEERGLPEDFDGYRVRLLYGIVGWVSLVAHCVWLRRIIFVFELQCSVVLMLGWDGELLIDRVVGDVIECVMVLAFVTLA